MKKSERQAAIEEIINQSPIATQEELMAQLKAKGITATQATISRDIRDMQIVKSPDETGHARYTIFKANSKNEQDRLFESLHDVVTGVDRVEFMNIIHTLPSNGNLLAAIIDDLNLPDVSGTLAGHDTIFVVSPSVAVATEFHELLLQHIRTEDDL
ncbi:arginine repressor [Lactobacillus sp.] [Lactiplantibacillus mudanjiangensis]|uniref:arginine repressor n=1 Tax=Lactiplantibacillus mudanjiangensis TaxID=1296538 RepID=UPI0010140FD7|nr:arginine repressor [Lactobacillus sp.] [Lactiplantibacillus mudanjiangensis]